MKKKLEKRALTLTMRCLVFTSFKIGNSLIKLQYKNKIHKNQILKSLPYFLLLRIQRTTKNKKRLYSKNGYRTTIKFRII